MRKLRHKQKPAALPKGFPEITYVPLKKLCASKNCVIAFDTETTGVAAYLGSRPFAFSFADAEGNVSYIEFRVDPFTRRVVTEEKPEEVKALIDVFSRPDIVWVCWNAAFDIEMAEMLLGIKIQGVVQDAMIAAHTVDSDAPNYKLKWHAENYAKIPQSDAAELGEFVKKGRLKGKRKGYAINPKNLTSPKPWMADYWIVQYAKDLGFPNWRQLKDLCKIYATYDAVRTILLWTLYDFLMDEREVRQVYELEMKVFYVMLRSQRRGVRIRYNDLKALRKKYEDVDASCMEVIRKYGEQARKKGLLGKAGSAGFNPNSNQQMAAVLYDHLKLKIPPEVFTYRKKGQVVSDRSVATDTLKAMVAQHEIVDYILRRSSVKKALEQAASYDYFKVWHPEDSVYRVHCSFRQTGTKTGRFSCTSPNLLQVSSENTGHSAHPIDTRASFGPSPGCVWYCCDYSQQEVRIGAAESQEPTMLKIISSGADIHDACTNQVWGGFGEAAIRQASKALGLGMGKVAFEMSPAIADARKKYQGSNDRRTALNFLEAFKGDIVLAEKSVGKKNTRNAAKLITFNKMYGGGVTAVMVLARCSAQEAQQFLDDWDKGFPDFSKWSKKLEAKARRDGFVYNRYGRRITVDKDKAYTAVNYVIQSGAADMLKRAIVQTFDYFKSEKIRAWMLMPIHDELVFEVVRSDTGRHVVRTIRKIMQDVGNVYNVPMLAEVDRVVRNWKNKDRIKWA